MVIVEKKFTSGKDLRLPGGPPGGHRGGPGGGMRGSAVVTPPSLRDFDESQKSKNIYDFARPRSLCDFEHFHEI